MSIRLARRLLKQTDKRLLWKLAWNGGIKSIRAIQKHKRRARRGEFFPPFLYISVTNACNLQCTGCWVDVTAPKKIIEAPAMHRMINEARAMGNSLFGIVGGEPLLHPELLDIIAAHSDCYFQVFTNAHHLTKDVAQRMRALGNVSPLVSVEGNEIVSDQRRGKSHVYERTMTGLQNCLDARLVTGVCTSLCQSNYDLLDEAWIDRLIELGVLYTWFHIYRPVGPQPAPDLCLTPAQQKQARQFVVEMRAKKPIIIVDAYYDGDGYSLCPAVVGFAHHISPWGDIEPCPVIQMANDSIHDERPLRDVFKQSAFLQDFRRTAAQHTRGCIVLERPDLLLELAERHGAHDSTARQTYFRELQTTSARASQYNPGGEVPEKSWVYRLFKHFWFHDYGTYQKYFESSAWRDTRAESGGESGAAADAATEARDS